MSVERERDEALLELRTLRLAAKEYSAKAEQDISDLVRACELAVGALDSAAAMFDWLVENRPDAAREIPLTFVEDIRRDVEAFREAREETP